MKIRNFIYATMLAVAAVVYTGCTKEDPDTTGTGTDGEVQLPEKMEFTLSVEEVEATSAKIRVTHNSEVSNASWFGFATTDLTSDVNTLVKAKVAEFNGNVTGLKRQNNLSVRVSGLESGTQYRYIVTGCLADGTVYGTAKASETFTTRTVIDTFTPNPAWTVSYVGEVTDEESGNVYEDCIHVQSTDDNTYIISVTYAEGWDAAYIPELLDEELAYWERVVASGYSWDDILYRGEGIAPYDLNPGEYIAFALGVDNEGNPTGLYAQSAPFTVVEQPASDEYNAWLGTWTWTGANNASFEVTFEHYENNKIIAMTGWEEIADFPVAVTFNKADGSLSIVGQAIGQANFADGSTGMIYFLPLDGEGYFYFAEVEMCNISLASAGNAAVTGGTVTNDAGTELPIDLMCFIADIDGTYYGLSEATIPTFPATLTKTADAQSLSTEKASTGIRRIETWKKPTLKLYYPLETR